MAFALFCQRRTLGTQALLSALTVQFFSKVPAFHLHFFIALLTYLLPIRGTSLRFPESQEMPVTQFSNNYIFPRHLCYLYSFLFCLNGPILTIDPVFQVFIFRTLREVLSNVQAYISGAAASCPFSYSGWCFSGINNFLKEAILHFSSHLKSVFVVLKYKRVPLRQTFL